MSKLNPHTKHREFSGVYGALSITIFLPTLIYFFALITNQHYSIQGINIDINKIIAQLPSNTQALINLFFDAICWKYYLSWFFTLVVFDQIIPGTILNGVKLRDGTSLVYKINGLAMSGILISVLLSRLFTSEDYYLPELEFIYENQTKLTATTILFSFLLAVFVYITSFIPLRSKNGTGTNERILSINGNTGNIIYDWFIGRELNPRIGGWDIKLFCELRPGMLLWLLINLSALHHQYHNLGYITDSMILVNFMQAFYIFDGVLNEEGCLTMIDITTDGFGYMLSFGDLAWLPWSYSLQTRYMSIKGNEVNLGIFKSISILGLMFLGFYIFKSANREKSLFRNGKISNLKYIQSEKGNKLLVEGWWGLSQHINYFGDWLIGVSWCLPTGFQTPLTYFYVIYFASLLIHRQVRDEMKCKEKYGKTWDEYNKIVPWKIIPYIY
ncbi:unnamed protein product [Candida verbasci]|uniref:Delta(14)-sterol reductase n=1 Tax=Candida verbasci TaxID=1227364 RepID=A0A9W4TZ76_9ASCO|nr:unnamed protein product [Candida verbasci]